MKIYVAGPYSASTLNGKIQNTNAAIDAAVKLLAKGHYPYIPHLTHFVDRRAAEIGITIEWEEYIRWDLVWLDLCDALLYLGSSRGADLELQFALKKGKRIYYGVGEIPSAEENS